MAADLPMGIQITVQTLFNLINNIMWAFAAWLIPTKFFGYPVKPSKKRRWLFLSVILVNSLAGGILIPCLAAQNGSAPDIPWNITNDIISTFFLIYWMFFLREPSRGKRLAILYTSDRLTTSFMTMIFCLTPSAESFRNAWLGVAEAYCQQFLALGLVFLAAWFSSRHRKEPMRFSLILSIWIFCEFQEIILSMFEVEGNQAVSSPIRISLQVAFASADDRSRIMTYAIAAIMAAIQALFLIITVKESESYFFQKKNTISEYYLETQKEHYAGLIESNREIRRIKHDMKNHIYCMKELYNRGKYEELGRYLDEIDEHIRHADPDIHVGNEIADAIITEKRRKASQMDIAFEVDGDMNGVSLAAIDICTIFSNIIDNAIEAVDKLSGADRAIRLEIKKNRNFLLISESNPVDHMIEIQDDTIATTKKEKGSHGFGILNIREAAAKYDGECQLELHDNGNGYEFSIAVMIPIRQEKGANPSAAEQQ